MLRLAILLSSLSFLCRAQEVPPLFFWADAAAGAGAQYNKRGTVSFAFGINMRKEKKGGSFRATFNEPFEIFTTPEGANSYALMADYYLQRPQASFWFGAGVGAVQYFTRGAHKPSNSFLGNYYYLEEHWAPSLPLDIQWHWGLSRFIGIGLRATADLNIKRPLGALLLDLRLGYMQDRKKN